MNQPVTRVDPNAIPTTLKEAVVDALLNTTYARVSGAGEFGQILYGARPRALLTSGFLLPAREQQGDDEVTSPIWISSHGLDLQVATDADGVIQVKPSAAIYVRVLPTVDDIKRPDCRLAFRLKRDVAKELRERLRAALDERWKLEKDAGQYESRWKHPKWEEIRQEVRSDVCERMGVPEDLRELFSTEPAEGAEVAVDEEVGEGVEVGAKMGAPLRDDLFEPMSIPHKWLRLDVELPELKLPLDAAPEARGALLEVHSAAMGLAIGARIDAWLEDENPLTGGKLWALPKVGLVTPSQYRDWAEYIESVRRSALPRAVPQEITLVWSVDVAPDWSEPSRTNLHIALENRTKPPSQHVDETEEAVFQVGLAVSLPTTAHRPLKLERVEPSYRYNQYLEYPAIGHNGSVETVSRDDALVQLRTTWSPRYVLPRIVPNDYPGIERTIRKLAAPDGLDGVQPIVAELDKWLADLPARIDTARGLDSTDRPAIDAETRKFREDLAAWSREISAVRAGLDLLMASRKHWRGRGPQSDARAIPFEAWLAMNEAMADMMRMRLKSDDGKWRLFQLAFVLANVCSIATRLPEFRDQYVKERDDTVTLLYFATGGGKSEAFFGLLVLALFFDRLRGKNLGVTAMIRYPLRLLTIQQAQRAAKVLAQAELVRTKHGYGGDRLSIGFWVGSGGSPNRHNSRGVADVPQAEAGVPSAAQETKLRETNSRYDAACKAWNKLPRCPFCGEATGLRRFAGAAFGGTLAHVCTNAGCGSHQGGYLPLPFYICDDDIYDLAPSVLLGTVDKLALIGHSGQTIRRIFGMFGLAPWRHATSGRLYVPRRRDEWREGPVDKGYEPLAPVYASGKAIFLDPFPALIVQDEAHLLDESLGTFAGLFESTLDGAFAHLAKALGGLLATDADGRRRRAKVIAASATVSEPQRQLEHLYQREVPAMQFPHPGPSLYESFYASPQEPDASETVRAALSDLDIEKRARQARVYTAFMTNGRPHTATAVATLAGFHLNITDLMLRLTNADAPAREAARQLLMRNLSPGILKAEFERRLAGASFSELATLVDLHRIALTYVTNKKGGDQILAAENEETRKRHLNENIDLPPIDTRLITGSIDQGEIQKVVELAQQRVKPGEAFEPIENVMRSVVATSAISHGVDVEELNSMFFAGMPSDIAEYIQASSRVGRTHVGFCLLIPTPQRRRDRYIVEVFDVFHRVLERMVAPAAIDRWADKAIERCFPSILQTYLCGVEPYRGLLAAAEDAKHGVPLNDSISEVQRQNSQTHGGVIAGVCRFAELAIGLRDGYSPEGEEHYQQLLRAKAQHLIGNVWTSVLYSDGTLDAFFRAQTDAMLKPMTSLRDVDQGGLIQMAPKDGRGKAQNSDAVLAVMSMVRHGVAEEGDDNG